MSAERMAEIEAALDDFESTDPHRNYDEYVASEYALCGVARAHLRWLLDRVRELEARAIAPVSTTALVEVGLRSSRCAMPPDGWQQTPRDHDAGHIAARSPSGEGQP